MLNKWTEMNLNKKTEKKKTQISSKYIYIYSNYHSSSSSAILVFHCKKVKVDLHDSFITILILIRLVIHFGMRNPPNASETNFSILLHFSGRCVCLCAQCAVYIEHISILFMFLICQFLPRHIVISFGVHLHAAIVFTW